METKPQDSVRRFFGHERVDGMKKGLSSFMTSDEYTELRQEINTGLARMPWPGAVEKIVEKTDELLDIPLFPILGKVYSQANLFTRYLDRDAYDAEESILVELADHAVDSSHEPHLDIEINGKLIGALKLNISLRLELKGLILKIQDAHIREIRPGACQGTGEVTFYGKVLMEKQSEEYKFLGPIDLGEGIPIAP